MACSVIIHAGLLVALNTPEDISGGLGHLPGCQVAITEFCAASDAMSEYPDDVIDWLKAAQRKFIAACHDEFPQSPSRYEIPTPEKLRLMKLQTNARRG